VLTGVFILLSTTARSSNALLAWNCGNSFASNVMYGVLYAMTPELFPTKDRGTGNAIVATANRVFGVMVSVSILDDGLFRPNIQAFLNKTHNDQAPIIALYTDLTTSVPIFVAGTVFVATGFIALLLPFEPRGHASLCTHCYSLLHIVAYH
jgi:MFS family permease